MRLRTYQGEIPHTTGAGVHTLPAEIRFFMSTCVARQEYGQNINMDLTTNMGTVAYMAPELRSAESCS